MHGRRNPDLTGTVSSHASSQAIAAGANHSESTSNQEEERLC